MTELEKLFKLTSGNDLELCYLNYDEEGIDFVSRTAKNNGVSSKVTRVDKIEPIPGGTISVSMGGSVMEAFVHENEYYTGYHIKILTPIKPMDINTMQFYCMCIRANKFKYSFGRQANNTISALLVPSLDEVPDWVKNVSKPDVKDIPNYYLEEGYEKACWYLDNVSQVKFEKEYRQSITSLKTQLKNIGEWVEYDLVGDNGIFECDKGQRLTKSNRKDGDIPLITAGKNRQGIADYIQDVENMKKFKDCITIDMFGNCFFHDYEFYCDDNIVVLKPKYNFNNFIALFMVTMIECEDFRYSFGRQYRSTKHTINQKIKLPSILNAKGLYEPDWLYMEEYIKSLPYSSSLQ